VLPAEVVADELVTGEGARALWLDVDVGEVDTDGEEARAESEEGNGGEELPGSGRGTPAHPTGLVGDLYGRANWRTDLKRTTGDLEEDDVRSGSLDRDL
jgi:hypothetical protein